MRIERLRFLAAGLALAVSFPIAFAETGQEAAPRAQLKKLLDEDLDASLRNFPWQATVRGVPGYDHLLPDLSFERLERERARHRDTLSQLKALDAKSLQGQDRVSYELLLEKMENLVEAQGFPEADALVLSTLGGVHNAMPRAAEVTPFRTVANYRDYVKRIEGTPAYASQTMERLRVGMKTGWMLPTAVLERVVGAIDAHLVDDADRSVLLQPFRKRASSVSEADLKPIEEAARKAIAEQYQPALRRFKAFILDEYRPKAPADGGLARLPRGKEYYGFLIRTRIVRGESAQHIHSIGLASVAALRKRIAGVAKAVAFKGTTDEFIEHLRTDRRFFFDSADEVLAAYRSMAQRVDPQLPKLFHAVPRMPYAVRAMTPAEAASSTAANYTIGSLKLGTPAYFTINALGYASEARWQKETLFLHEAVPGHHMQSARASEIEGLHPWRYMGSWNVAYGEGWALYAETLGSELGLYRDPYQLYGHLQAELFRAARLVVDTGIHHYGWPREKAIEYMSGQGGCDLAFATSEVDRYFSNPSQALGYMMGQRKFLELRARAEKKLGRKFDIRDFHAVAIDNGSLPLRVLEKLVDEWIASKAKA